MNNSFVLSVSKMVLQIDSTPYGRRDSLDRSFRSDATSLLQLLEGDHRSY